jgi:hypothetical protein
MSYSKSRYQTLCRLGVEQLPSLCSDRDFDDIDASSKGKHAYHESISPLAGNLPLRTMPVSYRIRYIQLRHFLN